ncbi:MCE family protein [Nocardioides limicola]|uniref:MCE family protein n=1 Tax=Nocardioides limicola TaxID=2803368 RepID=UPI00193AF21E|nr:MlaD family protein [Nocardioides sp. DJM-14]
MISRRTKIQLLIFVAITLLGVSFVGARYAKLDRYFYDSDYRVTAHFADSGGIFPNAEVTYRGVRIGKVGHMELTADGVDVRLDIEKKYRDIPADTRALVGNRSAVGEHYVELQPRVDTGPYLENGSTIARANTQIPISTTTLLTNISTTVSSVDQDALRTSVSELGLAFGGAGESLRQIITTGNSFIETANDNFELTRDLIRDSNVVLRGQVDSASAIRSFARDLNLFTGSLVASDDDLRRVINRGSGMANALNALIEDNEENLGELIHNLVTTGEVVVRHLDGIQQILILYPMVVEGSFSVVDPEVDTGLMNANFGMILTENPHICHEGYEGTDRRPPQNGGNRPMNEDARCTEPASKSNPRGAQHAPRAPVFGHYDPITGEVTIHESAQDPSARLAPRSLGEESWKWLYLQPLLSAQE